MKQIIISSITDKGTEAFEQHVKNTTLKDKLIMRSLGVKQELDVGILTITIDNAALRFTEKNNPAALKDYFDKEMSRLTNEMSKLGIENEVDFKIEVR